jgi:hypothetical protein
MPKEIKIKVPEIDEIMPADVRRHLIQSYKEFLIALKRAIDIQIEKLDEIQEKIAPEKKEIQRINVE